MLLLSTGLAVAADMTFDPDLLPTLPLQVQEEARWTAADLHNVELSRSLLYTGIGGLAVGAAGAGLLLLAEVTDDRSGVLTAGGVAGAVVGGTAALVVPPALLMTSMRSHRSLKERGVFVSSTAGVAGWTLVATGVMISPVFVVAPYTLPFWYAGVVGCAVGQLQINERGRRAAGLTSGGPVLREVTLLPAPGGGVLVGRF